MKSIVLLSSGLDSTVNFCKALRETEIVKALTFDYGQRAAQKEIESAQKICARYSVAHEVIRLEWLSQITKTALVDKTQALPKLQSSELDDLSKTNLSAQKVWVPNRNGVFINIAASFAESLGTEAIVVGFNAEEAATFPDNSASFVERMNHSLEFSTLSRPQVVCYTQSFNKKQIVQLGKELHAPFELMWSCYESGNEMCRQCESCKRFYRAMPSVKVS